MQKTDGYDDNLKAESYVIQQINERWHLRVAHLGEPYYGGTAWWIRMGEYWL